jgi:hypothetical protein
MSLSVFRTSPSICSCSECARSFCEDNSRWPAEDKWVNDILPYLDFPMAFRCPSRSDKDYVYHKPPAGAKDDFVLISCVHPFLHKVVVLHKDETVTIDDLAPGSR